MIPQNHPLAEKEGTTLEAADLLPYDLIIPSRASRLDEINSWFAYTKKNTYYPLPDGTHA